VVVQMAPLSPEPPSAQPKPRTFRFKSSD
jgi:hypothetical protein